MSKIGTTYSFKDLSGIVSSPIAGSFQFAGQVGVGKVVVANATDHTAHDTASDGTVMPSFIAGDSGDITIECQQTSLAHKFLLAWLNTLKTYAMNGDVSNWATTSALFRNTLDGSVHECTGISPMKSVDKTYSTQGEKVTWKLMACNVVNL
jgi:hypothetical protein